jgi:putative spermidine/putrescine transport system permease protein
MILVINIAMLVLVLAPVVLVVWMSFTPTASFVLPLSSFSLRWYREALSYPGFVDAFVLSAELAAIASLITVAATFLAAYGLVRYRPPGGDALMGFFTSPLLVPAVVFGIAMLQFVNSLGLYNQFVGLVLAHVILVVPFAIRALTSTLGAVPEDLEWAAMILGRGRLGMLLRVTLPLCATVAAVSAMVVFISLALVLALNLMGGFRRIVSR